MKNDFKTYLTHERAKHSCEHAFISFVSELIVIVLTVVLIWDMFSHHSLLLSLSAAIVVSLVAFRLPPILSANAPLVFNFGKLV